MMNQQEMIGILVNLDDAEMGEFLECLECTDKVAAYQGKSWYSKVHTLFEDGVMLSDVCSLAKDCALEYFSGIGIS